MSAITIEYADSLHTGQKRIWSYLMNSNKYGVHANTGRQVGKTTLGKRAAIQWAMDDPGCSIGWLAPETRHFSNPFDFIKQTLAQVIQKAEHRQYIRFKNGSVIYFYSMENYEAIRGQTFDYIIMDEYAFGRFGQQECISAYAPTMVAKGKKQLILSTPNGKNHHYHSFKQHQKSDDWFTYEMKTEDNPMVDKAWLLERKTEMPVELYKQEYEGKFLETGGEVFSGIDVVSTIAKYTGPIPGRQYVFGIDWGAKSDKSVLTVMDYESYEVAGITVSRHTSYVDQIDEFVKIIKTYHMIGGYAETNGVGQATFDYLKKQVRFTLPWIMSQSSKKDIVTGLIHHINTDSISLPSRELEPELYFQLSDYQARVSGNGQHSYSHPPGGHDDLVDSLMMAVKCADKLNNGIAMAMPGTDWTDVADSHIDAIAQYEQDVFESASQDNEWGI